MTKTKEPQYSPVLEQYGEMGGYLMPPVSSHHIRNNPKRYLFSLARYKFASRMIGGKENFLEIGCGDGHGLPLLLQEVPNGYAVDFDPIFVKHAKNHAEKEGYNVTFGTLDITKDAFRLKVDSIVMLDVFEHIHPHLEDFMMQNILKTLNSNGVAVIGIPSLEHQKYASDISRAGHVNCKSGEQFKKDLLKWFGNVFLFSMNDETVHTGFRPMANYLIAVCVKNGLGD